MAKTYNTISTFTAGQVLTAAQMNDLGENSNNYRVPPAAVIYRSSTAAVSSGVAINFDASAVVDTDSMTTNKASGYIEVSTPGIYVASWGFRFSATSGATYCDATLYFGSGSAAPTGLLVENYGLAFNGNDGSSYVSAVLSLAANDTVGARITTNGVSPVLAGGVAHNRFSLVWLGQAS
jgi:hypothetical protein